MLEKIEDSERKRKLISLKKRVAQAVKMRKENQAYKGPKAKMQVQMKLMEECGLWVVKGQKGCFVALKMSDNRIKFPLEATGVKVLNFPLTRHTVQVNNSKINRKDGPFYVIVVEINHGEYSYLAYTHSEMLRAAGANPELLLEKAGIGDGAKEQADYLTRHLVGLLNNVKAVNNVNGESAPK